MKQECWQQSFARWSADGPRQLWPKMALELHHMARDSWLQEKNTNESMLQLVVLEKETHKMTQAANKNPSAEHARAMGAAVGKLKLEALARMLWMIPAVAAANLQEAVEEEAQYLHLPFFVVEVEVEAASLCAIMLF
jgi:hypothetical protein